MSDEDANRKSRNAKTVRKEATETETESSSSNETLDTNFSQNEEHQWEHVELLEHAEEDQLIVVETQPKFKLPKSRQRRQPRNYDFNESRENRTVLQN